MNDENGHLLVASSQITRFERGFKSWSENIAQSLRSRLGLSKYDPLSPFLLANHLKVTILTPSQITGLNPETITYLTSNQGDEWSAVTVRTNGIDVIILNPFHSERRQANTLMHELSHIIKGHKSMHVFMNPTGITFRNFDVLQEAEADWLAGTLLLPRDILVHCFFKHYSSEEACRIYGVSNALFSYRMNISGVKKQFKR